MVNSALPNRCSPESKFYDFSLFLLIFDLIKPALFALFSLSTTPPTQTHTLDECLK